jgi:hypothetical protein
MDAPDLFSLAPTAQVEPADRDLSIDERFAIFHAANPAVYAAFRRHAETLLNAGRKRYSADGILHRVRWDMDIQTTGDTYKLNDHYSSRYARKMAAEDRRFAEFFEFRTLRSKHSEAE